MDVALNKLDIFMTWYFFGKMVNCQSPSFDHKNELTTLTSSSLALYVLHSYNYFLHISYFIGSLKMTLHLQGYKIIGSHSGVKICRWTKSQLRGRGGCYKHSFYGIESHR